MGKNKWYKIKKGDCLSRIAVDHGITWQRIWNHPKNSNLKKSRKNPNIVLAGDKFFIPNPESRSANGNTEFRHRFVRKGVPSKLRIRLLSS